MRPACSAGGEKKRATAVAVAGWATCEVSLAWRGLACGAIGPPSGPGASGRSPPRSRRSDRGA